MRIGIWGDGFIGRGVAATLKSSGADVCILNRRGEPKARIENIPTRAMPFEADENAMRAALADLDILVHCAGKAKQDHDAYYAATLGMAKAAVAAHLHRVIMLSTVAVYGGALSGEGMGATFTVDKSLPPLPVTDYSRSRLRTEIDARRMLESGGVGLTIVRVPMVIGPGMNAMLFRRLACLLGKGVFPCFTKRHAVLPVIGIRRLSHCLSQIATEPTLTAPLYQIADNISWTALIDRFRIRLGLRFLSLPLPGHLIYGALRLLGLGHIAGPLHALLNTAEYADDSPQILGIENADKWPTIQCIEESIEALAK